MSFTSDGMLSNSEIDSLELVFLYVKSYKILHDISINLNPKFNTEYKSDGILYIETRASCFLKEEFSNVKLLCGENGVGKSSILQLLRNPGRSDGSILVMKTTSNKFISNECIVINYDGKEYSCNQFDMELKFGEFSIAQDDLYDDGLNFQKHFLSFYEKEKMLFSDIDSELLTHFQVSYWPGDVKLSSVLHSIRNKLSISDVTEFDLKDLRKKDLLSYLFYNNFGDSSFQDWTRNNIEELSEILKQLTELNIPDILIKIRKVFFDPKDSDEISTVIMELKKMIGQEFTLDKYEEVSSTFYSLSNKYDELLEPFHEKNNVHQWGNDITSLLYLNGYKKIKNDLRYINELSYGEYMSVRNRYHLYAKMIQQDSAIILEDEPDLHLHPEWSRTFVNNFFSTVKHLRQYLGEHRDIRFKTKIYNFVLTTHSPIVLSDFFNEEVIFFQKYNNEVFINDRTQDCFAGNIGDILIDNFFLTKTIGEYAENKLKEVIHLMEKASEGLDVSGGDRIEVEYIISRIGDKLLKKILHEKFMRVFNEDNKA